MTAVPPSARHAAHRPLRRAVFIDKDGTLVENVPYNVDPALPRFRPAALPTLAALARAGFVLLLATSPAGADPAG